MEKVESVAYIENFFELFFENKNSLNRQFYQGDITKKEYIESNYFFLKQLDKRPFKNVDNLWKAIYNYQYYNMTGKYFKMLAGELEEKNKHPEKAKEYFDKVNYLYRKKDENIFHVIRLTEGDGIRAYYIRVQSKYLKHKLFEVLLENEEINAVFHSINPVLQKRLDESGLFEHGNRRSVIDNYVNTLY